MLNSFARKRSQFVVAMLFVGTLLTLGSVASAGIIIDNFPQSGNLTGNGIKVENAVGSTTVTDTGIASSSVFGGTRITRLELNTVSGPGNPGVSLKIPGSSDQVMYKSDNSVLVDGLFDFLYNGTAAGSFPLDFSAALAAILIDVHFHTNPGATVATVFNVTLFNNANATGLSATSTQTLTGGVSSSQVLTFANPSFVPQVGFDFSTVRAIEVNVNPNAGTNIDLKEISTTAVHSEIVIQAGSVPEPSSLIVWGLLGLAVVVYRRHSTAA